MTFVSLVSIYMGVHSVSRHLMSAAVYMLFLILSLFVYSSFSMEQAKVPKAIIHDVDLRSCTTQEGISVQVGACVTQYYTL